MRALKTKAILISCLSLGTALAQAQVKNPGFEFWTLQNNKNIPTGWQVDTAYSNNDIIRSQVGGSEGSYSVFMGSTLFLGDPKGSEMQLHDTLSKFPGHLLFDSQVYNAINDNGIYLQVFFFDSLMNPILDFAGNSKGNHSNWVTDTVYINLPAFPTPKYVDIEASYYNLDGSLNEYGLLDNLRFLMPTVASNPQVLDPVSVVPVPVGKNLHIRNLPAGENRARLVCMDRRVIEFPNCGDALDLEKFNPGIYLLELYGESNNLLLRQKIVIGN